MIAPIGHVAPRDRGATYPTNVSAARIHRLSISFVPTYPASCVLAIALSACASRPSSPPPVVVIDGDRQSEIAPSPLPEEAEEPRPERRLWTWETNMPRARTRALRERLPMLVHLAADWSAASLAMAREVWSDPRIMFQRAPIVALRIDVTDDSSDAEIAALRFDARSIPTTIVFDGEGREVARIEGQATVDEVLAAIRAAGAEP